MAESTSQNPLKKPMKRRDFVKTSMKIAAGGAIIAGATPIIVSANPIRRGVKRFPYVGARILPPGPAPQGIPLIPLKVNADGILEGIPENTKSSVKHSLEWYKYCGHQGAPGLDPNFTDDNKLRYYGNSEKMEQAKTQGFDVWYEELMDQEVRADHFKELGWGAPFRWRSEGQEQNNIITGIIIKVDPSKMKGKLPDGFVWDNKDGTGFLAVCSFCAHFCCVPGYLENNSPKSHEPGKGINDTVIYCSCHDSRYDFMDVRQYQFPPDF